MDFSTRDRLSHLARLLEGGFMQEASDRERLEIAAREVREILRLSAVRPRLTLRGSVAAFFRPFGRKRAFVR